MAYKMYIAGVLMPITPSKVSIKTGSQNRTLTLIGGEEINLLKDPKLTDVSFDLLLPQVPYPFSRGTGAEGYLSLLQGLKQSKTPFQWILSRIRPDGKALFYSNLTVALEDLQTADDAREGFDLKVSVRLRQYRPYGTRRIRIVSTAPSKAAAVTVQEAPRDTGSAPQSAAYTTKTGDTLWNISKKQLGDGDRWKDLQMTNLDMTPSVADPSRIPAGQTLRMPHSASGNTFKKEWLQDDVRRAINSARK